ncbi:MAG: hypothetical protein LBT67_01510, partial [Holosporaceae bacterium]|nr:hypothetical protein [Holosporaceae bacterium]
EGGVFLGADDFLLFSFFFIGFTSFSERATAITVVTIVFLLPEGATVSCCISLHPNNETPITTNGVILI